MCIPSESERMDDIAATMRRMDVNSATLTSTVARLISPNDVPTLQTLTLTGEAVSPSVVETWLAHVKLLTAYGPSECSVHSSVSAPVRSKQDAPLIGNPLACRFWVVCLDNPDWLVPIGVAGELLIEGPRLAREYLNDAAKTESSFLVNPGFVHSLGLVTNQAMRLYRSGDIVRRNCDGTFTYLGRRDTQIKIRGQRVEAGEIEAAIISLLSGASMASVHLVQQADRPDEPLLVAVVQIQVDDETDDAWRVIQGETQDLETISSNQLDDAILAAKGALVERLPAYMVPKVILATPRLPLNASGKLDRKRVQGFLDGMSNIQLGSLAPAHSAAVDRDEQPRTAMEHTLQKLWSSILRRPAESIATSDNFFHIGGDSVLAMRMVAMSRGQDVSLSVVDIFKAPRLSDLAAFISAKGQRLGHRMTGDLEGDPIPFSLWRASMSEPEASSEAQLSNLAQQCGVLPTQIEDAYPCTPLQEGLMTITSYQPEAYIVQRVFKLHERIEISHLKEAWGQLVSSLTILRTRIVPVSATDESSTSSMQVVIKELVDWTHASDLGGFLGRDKARPMAYGQPLSRWAIIEESTVPKSRYLVWTMHHSVYDGWSGARTLHLLSHLLRGERLPKVVPVSRFVRFLGQQDETATQSFWKDQFESSAATSFPQIPKGHQPQPETRIHRRMQVSQRPGLVTTALTLRAAWALLVATHTVSDDVVIYVTDSGRNVAVDGIIDLIAPTITSMPVRIRINNSDTVRMFLSAIQEQAVAMMSFAHAGLQNIRRIVPALGATEVGLGHMLTVQTVGEQVSSQDHLSVAGLETIENRAKGFLNYALNLECITGLDDNATIAIEGLYDQAVISTSEAEGLLDQFEHICQKLLQHNEEALQDQYSNHRVNDIGLLSQSDMLSLTRWSRASPTGADVCIHELVVKRAAQHPQGTAVQAWDGSLSYEECLQESARLAHHLVSLGAGPEVKIGLCMDKSVCVPVSMLAILLAGAVVVPFSVQAPLSRMRIMLGDTKAKFIITDAGQTARLKDIDTRTFEVSRQLIQRLSLSTSSSLPLSDVEPKSAAWIVYTSGSTGTPKGVVLSHAALSTSILAHGPALGIGEMTRQLNFAEHTFDATIQEIFTTLCHGGCVCIPSEYDRINNLVAFMADSRVNTAFITPTVAGIIPPASVPTLKTLVLIGEAVKPDIVESWLPHANVLNGYGPSECSILSTTGPIRDIADASNIGHSLAGCCWVVDAHDANKLVPVGAPGELLIEGPLLARGYLNDEAKTAASFISDPDFARLFCSPGSTIPRRMYRTGDIVKQKPDGSFVYLGRRDAQVKIRGQRVETGEVETWIRRLLPNATVASVHLIKHAGREPMLAAVVEIAGFDGSLSTPSNGKIEPTEFDPHLAKELRHVQAKLPDHLPIYMVPSIIIPFSHLPVNSSGKLDRKALQQLLQDMPPAQLDALTDTAKEAPSTPMEEILQRLWAKALRRPKDDIGSHDHFFYIGGDSISAMRMVAATQQSHSPPLSLTVMDIFSHPRLSDLAKVLTDNMTGTSADVKQIERDPLPFTLLDPAVENLDEQLPDVAQLCGLHLHEVADVYPCTPLQEGLMTITAQRPDSYVSQRVFKLDGTVQLAAFTAAWDALVASTPILRTRIVPHAKLGMLQVVTSQGLQWVLTHQTVEKYIKHEKTQAMTYGQPLCRLAIVEPVDKASSHRYFVWTMHHSIYDGWSLSRLLQSVVGIMKGEKDANLPRTSMTRFIRYLQQGDEPTATRFWQEQLHDVQFSAFPALPHPSYKPRPRHNAKRSIELGEVALQSGSSVTTSTLLRAAWAIVVSTYTTSEDVVLNSVSSGRNAPVVGMLHVAGPTVTSYPVRVKVNPQEDVLGFLDKLHDQATNLIPFEHTGVQNIRRMVSVLGDASTRDPFGHMFVVQTAMEALDWNDGQEAFNPMESTGMTSQESSASGFYSHGFNLACAIASESISLDAWYDEAVISKARANAVLEQLDLVFQSLLKVTQGYDGTQPKNTKQLSPAIGDMSLMTDSGLEAIRTQNENIPAGMSTCLQAPLLEVAKQRPHAPAIHAWDGLLTYQDLVQLSGRLAQHLVMHNAVRPEVMIAVSMSKSKWAIVAMLAILRAGGAVVPLGVNLPAERTRTILCDTATTLVLTDEVQSRNLAAIDVNVQLLQVDLALLESLPEPDEDDTPGQQQLDTAEPSNAAWVIYTSGSTGVPKGVVLTHASLATSIHAHGEAFNLGPQTRQFQFASYTFDVSIQEIFTTLCYAGGSVCVPQEQDRVGNLAGSIRDLEANTLTLTSTVAKLVSPGDVPLVHTLVLTGEAVAADVVETWLGNEGGRQGTRVFNAYGPAECTIFASTKELQTKEEASVIGCPLGSVFWVTKPNNPNQLVPHGAPGELLIEGPLVARGYLHNAEKTAEAFITDPRFMQALDFRPGRRMYRTGDLVVQNEDGHFTYLGRQDTQIKIHGQRVELGEIEATIGRLVAKTSRVSVSVVSQGHTGRSESTLVCAVEFPNHSSDGDLDQDLRVLEFTTAMQQQFQKLRHTLVDLLPSYMIPVLYVPVSHIPSTTSAKVDRNRLTKFLESLDRKQWQQFTSGNTTTVAPPETTRERVLGAAWATLLRVSESSIDRHADFFRMGGDSIMAMQLVAQLKTISLGLTVPEVFKYPKLESMALRIVDEAEDNNSAPEYTPLSLVEPHLSKEVDEFLSSTKDVMDVLPVTDFQAYSIAGNLMDVRMELYHFVWTAKGSPPDLSSLQATLRKLTQEIESLRTAFVFFQGISHQVVLRHHTPEIQIYFAEHEPVEEALKSLMSTRDVFGPVQPGKPPFDVAVVHSKAADEHCLVFRMSHALYDGLTLPMIWKEMQACYNHHQEPQPILQHPPFRHFVSALKTAAIRLDSKAYWRNLLHGASMPQIGSIPPLERDHTSITAGLETVHFPWSGKQFPSITASMVLKAAWALVLGKHTNHDDVSFGEITSGRNTVPSMVANAPGCCVAAVPVRIVLDQVTISDLLYSIRDQQLASVSHQAVGLETISRDCTDWQSKTQKFSSYVNHQRADTSVTAAQMRLGKTPYSLSIFNKGDVHSFVDVYITTIQRADRVNINMAYAIDSVTEGTAEHLLSNLLRTVDAILQAAPDTNPQKLLAKCIV